jgi:hypothetical protein
LANLGPETLTVFGAINTFSSKAKQLVQCSAKLFYNSYVGKPSIHPGLINSSYVVFFHVLTVAWGVYFASYFPPELRTFSTLVNVLYPILLFWFVYMLRQFEDATVILKLAVGFFCLSAGFAFLSAVRGPLADGYLPKISILFLGSHILSGSYMSLLYAGVVLFYGYVTYVSAVLSSSLLEFIYTRAASRKLPKQLRQILERADKSVDSTAILSSDKYFFMNQDKGLFVTIILVAVFALFYTIGVLIS